jgi:hypothetical protein
MQNILGLWLYSLKHYALMCILLSSPARLPNHINAFALTLGSYFLLGLFLVDEQRNYLAVFAQILLELLLLGLIAYYGLRWKKFLPRFQQTFSALVGINLIISVVSIPVYRIVRDNQADSDILLIYITLVILLWNLAVLSLIFKRSLEISTHFSAMIAFNYFILYQFIVYRFY